jgi:hypothetical protein
MPQSGWVKIQTQDILNTNWEAEQVGYNAQEFKAKVSSL